MAHNTHHGDSKENTSIISFKNSFWLVVIIVGLFIAALNFIQVESEGGEEHHHGEAHKTHETHAIHEAAKEEAHEAQPAAAHEGEKPAEEPKAEEAPAKEAEHHNAH
jgi:hypothetical protein